MRGARCWSLGEGNYWTPRPIRASSGWSTAAASGLAVVVVDGDQCEVLSLASQLQRAGVGRALMQRCFAYAREQGCRRVWLTTTNDNVTAIAFYQRIGMDLCALHLRAVEQARLLKPTIPMHDDHGVAIAHELEFELLLA